VQTLLDVIREERGHLDDFDLAIITAPGIELPPPATLGATWTLHGLWPGTTPDEVLRLLTRRD
jgi:hypothetical protein